MSHHFVLSLRETNAGQWSDEPEFAEIAICHVDGAYATTLTLTFAEDEMKASVANPEAAATIFGCNGPLHLIAAATTAIMSAYTEDHELYTDVFHDEDCNNVELPLIF